MKILDKIALVLFSSIILIISIIMCLLVFGWINFESINIFMKYLLNDEISSNISLGIAIIFILLAIKGIFFTSDSKSDSGIDNGVLLENENGKLLISRETIQNLVSGAVKKFETAQDVTTKVILNKDNNVNIDVTLFVTPDAVIKDLSVNLQVKIKEVIKSSLDLEVKQVNIKVKNIAQNKETVQG